jgi:hypothetical protein
MSGAISRTPICLHVVQNDTFTSYGNEPSCSTRSGELLNEPSNFCFSRRILLLGVAVHLRALHYLNVSCNSKLKTVYCWCFFILDPLDISELAVYCFYWGKGSRSSKASCYLITLTLFLGRQQFTLTARRTNSLVVRTGGSKQLMPRHVTGHKPEAVPSSEII